MTKKEDGTLAAARANQASVMLRRLGLPDRLCQHVRNGTLLAAIKSAEEAYDRLVQALDEWELTNPAAAALVPWREQREAWKAAGRPRPPWYELLAAYESDTKPIRRKDIESKLYSYGVRGYERAARARRRNRCD